MKEHRMLLILVRAMSRDGRRNALDVDFDLSRRPKQCATLSRDDVRVDRKVNVNETLQGLTRLIWVHIVFPSHGRDRELRLALDARHGFWESD